MDIEQVIEKMRQLDLRTTWERDPKHLTSIKDIKPFQVFDDCALILIYKSNHQVGIYLVFNSNVTWYNEITTHGLYPTKTQMELLTQLHKIYAAVDGWNCHQDYSGIAEIGIANLFDIPHPTIIGKEFDIK